MAAIVTLCETQQHSMCCSGAPSRRRHARWRAGADVHARDQLLGVATASWRVVAGQSVRLSDDEMRLVQWETAQELEAWTV